MSKLLPLFILTAAITAQPALSTVEGTAVNTVEAQARAVADELLAADVAASAASLKTTAIPGLTAMFAQDVIMQAPVVGFARGVSAAADALKANPDNATGKVEWTPVRAGISADGLHGFTFGYMTMRRPDGTTAPIKYLAYWVKRDGRWQVAAYKRRLRAGAFSDDAQKIGLGPAFAKYGAVDAMNMGGPNDAAFVIGAETIGRSIGAGRPPTAAP